MLSYYTHVRTGCHILPSLSWAPHLQRHLEYTGLLLRVACEHLRAYFTVVGCDPSVRKHLSNDWTRASNRQPQKAEEPGPRRHRRRRLTYEEAKQARMAQREKSETHTVPRCRRGQPPNVPNRRQSGMCTATAPAALDGAMETGESHATLRLPAPPAGKPRARALALPPDACTDACARHARTHNLRAEQEKAACSMLQSRQVCWSGKRAYLEWAE